MGACLDKFKKGNNSGDNFNVERKNKYKTGDDDQEIGNDNSNNNASNAALA